MRGCLGVHDLKPFSQAVAADQTATACGVSSSLDPVAGSARFTCAARNDLAVEADFDGIPTE